jgi:hypothetical protein
MRHREGVEDRWRQRIEEQQASGLSVEEFCRRESINRGRFYLWRRRMASAAREGFVAVNVASSVSCDEVEAEPFRVKRSAVIAAKIDRPTSFPAIEVHLVNGRTLLVPWNFDRDHLVKLIAAVEVLA